jgi:hypothetical protein
MSKVQQIIVAKTIKYLDDVINHSVGKDPLLVVPVDFINYRPPKTNVIKITQLKSGYLESIRVALPHIQADYVLLSSDNMTIDISSEEIVEKYKSASLIYSDYMVHYHDLNVAHRMYLQSITTETVNHTLGQIRCPLVKTDILKKLVRNNVTDMLKFIPIDEFAHEPKALFTLHTNGITL